MGWTFYASSKEQLIADLVKPSDTPSRKREVIVYTLVDDVLWTVEDVTRKGADPVEQSRSLFIGCTLIDCSSHGWGYKGMEESMHPYYYTCPLSYLNSVPEACPEWRMKVRQYHEALS